MAVLPDFDAARFEPGAPIDNPFFPLEPGTVFSYGGTQIDQDTGEAVIERNNLFTTFQTQEIGASGRADGRRAARLSRHGEPDAVVA